MINTELTAFPQRPLLIFSEGSAKEADKIFYQFRLFISNHVSSSSHILGIHI